MSKKVILTDRIRDLIAKATDGAVDPNTVSVFECIAINTKPLSKRGSIFDKGVPDASLLYEMADYLNAGGAVPLHTMHQQSFELPVGKTIYAEVKANFSGISELRALFYLPNSETDLIAKLESDVINEVSVGVRSKQLCCSKCGFDFLGEKATFENLWTMTCDEGHTMGEDGAHVILKGMDRWMELSLVSLGAANNAKILARTKQLLGADQYNQLAASGIRPEVTTLFATTSQEKSMDLEKVIGEMSDLKASVTVKSAELATATATIATLNAQVAELNTNLAAAQEAAKVKPEVADLQAQVEAGKAVLAFVRSEADRLAVACGEQKLPEDATFDALKASIEKHRLVMAEKFPVGGAAQASATGTGTNPEAGAVASVFKTR